MMSIHSRFFVKALICLIAAGCSMPGQAPTVVHLAPTETLDFSDAKATLTVVHNVELLIGKFTITAAVPLLFGVVENDPEKSTIVWGVGIGTGLLDSGASGTGGSYAVSTEIPVEYVVTGTLRPSRSECLLELTVNEKLMLAQPVDVYVEPLGIVPMVLGDNQVTTLPGLLFPETDPKVTNPFGTDSVFTIDDWCLPAETYCTLGCSSE